MLNRKMQPAAVPPQAAVTRSALKDRLLDPRTLISFGILAVVLFVVAFRWPHPTSAVLFWIAAVGLAGLAVIDFYGRRPAALSAGQGAPS